MNTYLRILFALLGLAVPVALNYYYHPSTELSLLGGILTLLLVAVVSWSAIRFGSGAAAVLKVAAISLVASFMVIQAFDAIYILQAAPMGGRLAFLPELLLWAISIAVSSMLFARALSRPKK